MLHPGNLVFSTRVCLAHTFLLAYAKIRTTRELNLNGLITALALLIIISQAIINKESG